MSPSTCSGSRTLARTMRNRSSFISPSRASGMIGMAMPFLEHLSAVRPHAEPADVDDVDGVGEQRDRLAAIEGRRDHRDVVQMAGGEPGIVGDVVVARLHAGERILSRK